MDFSNITTPQKVNLFIAFMDIQGFLGITKKQNDLIDLFKLLNGWAKIIVEDIENANGKVIKFIGDACLIVFPQEETDKAVNILFSVKRKAEQYLTENGYGNKIKITAHIGEVVVGEFSLGDHKSIDVFGDTVNIASSLDNKNHHGQLILSPQVFRKLKASTRRMFHKYTPPIVYLAEEC